MKNVFLFLFFILYVLLIFSFDSFLIQAIFLLINIVLLLVTKISLLHAFYNIRSLSFFIFLTAIINVFLGSINEAILITIRLILVCNITYIFKTSLGTSALLDTISKIFTPLKFIGISSKDISLIINIAITFIPNLVRDFYEIQNLLLSKGVKKYSLQYIKYSFKILFNSVFKRTNSLELCLKSKGYVE